jgi:PTS system sucrose-specific IIC component
MLSAADGLNIWMPIASAANFAQGAACLAVGLKAKNVKTKSVAIPSALSAALGITEPAIFGINLRFVKPLVCGMAGGAVGAILGSIFHIGATSYGVTGIPGFLITLDYTLQYAIVLAVAFVVSFTLTWFVWKEETEEEQSTVSDKKQTENAAPALAAEGNILYAPLKGNVIARENIPDETFASGVLGDGVGIEPEIGEVIAPFDGEISSVTDTKHAVGISGPQGMEVLIHVGVDTVNMKGDGFELLVHEGDKIKAGQKLIRFDISKIKAAGYSTTTAVLLTNSDDFSDLKVLKNGQTDFMEKLLAVE